MKCELLCREKYKKEDWPNHLVTIEELVDDSDYMRSIKQCSCGQIFFYEFIELKDYENGNDAIYRMLIPIPDRKTGHELNTKPSTELTKYTGLRFDWPSDKKDPNVYLFQGTDL